MNLQELARTRLSNLGLSRPRAERPEDVIRSLLAMQSQDYGPAKWSIGQRLVQATDADLDRAYLEGRILRTHILRPTWHFVHPLDIGWLLALTGPRVHAKNGYRYRQLDLDDALLKRSTKVVARALGGSNHLTRKELREVLARNRIQADTSRLGYILMNAELNGTICSGGLRGKQHTYALLEERAPGAIDLDRDQALIELVVRYFESHGPASVKDLQWWSSLPVKDLRRGVEMAELQHENVEGIDMYFIDAGRRVQKRSPDVHLLQAYDEYMVGYTATRRVLDMSGEDKARATGGGLFTGAVVLDTQIAGRWKKRLEKDTLRVEVSTYGAWTDPQLKALDRQTQRLARFMGADAFELEVTSAHQP